MVARAAYAIERGFIAPERILLLAFNRAAAQELQQRVKTRLAPWLDGGQDMEMVGRIVDELRDRSPQFQLQRDLFRLFYARLSATPDGGAPAHWGRQMRKTGFRTANDETVKSEGERLIADWLLHNGVEYRYEQPYVHDVADASHSQYRPDFYYPQIDVWHEHWALGFDGKPPALFTGYAESMAWKKQLVSTEAPPWWRRAGPRSWIRRGWWNWGRSCQPSDLSWTGTQTGPPTALCHCVDFEDMLVQAGRAPRGRRGDRKP